MELPDVICMHVCASSQPRKRCSGIAAAFLEPFKASYRDSWDYQSDNPTIVISLLFDQTWMSLREGIGKVIIG